jgi:hypothetical protein
MENLQDKNINAELIVNDFKEVKLENEKLIITCENMIARYQEKILEYKGNIENAEESLKQKLFSMIPEEDYKETRTQYTYKTPSCKLTRKKAFKTIALKTDYIEKEIPKEFIKIKKSVDWINFKKDLVIEGESIINKTTGEIIESCEIKNNLESFKIKLED